MKTRLKAAIWQAVAQSGVDLSGLPQAEQDKLVSAITDGMLQEVDDILSEVSGTPTSTVIGEADEAGDDDEERTLWEGRPFLSLRVHYQITTERVKVVEGLLGKERYDVELVRIQDVDHKQNLTERTLNIGDIFIRSHDPGKPELTLHNVSNPAEVHEILRRALLKARKKYNLSYREEM
jgi:hypothetical protein